MFTYPTVWYNWTMDHLLNMGSNCYTKHWCFGRDFLSWEVYFLPPLCFIQAEENLGMVMIFTLVTAVQEKLNEIVDQIKTRREEEKKQKEKEAEEAEKVYLKIFWFFFFFTSHSWLVWYLAFLFFLVILFSNWLFGSHNSELKSKFN